MPSTWHSINLLIKRVLNPNIANPNLTAELGHLIEMLIMEVESSLIRPYVSHLGRVSKVLL